MTTQPKHHWTFDENTGSVASDAVGSVNGTLSPKVIREAQGRIGSGAMHIDGSNDSFVTFGTSVGQFGINDFTVAFWLRTTETYKYFDLVGNRTAGSHGNFFCLRMTGRHESKPEGMVVAEVDQDGNNYIALESTKTGLNDGNWHHLAVARKGTSLKLYVDGALSAEGTASGVANISNGNEFKLGRSLVGVDDKFAPDAHYDDLRLYDVALPDEEIANLFTLSSKEKVKAQIHSLGNYTLVNQHIKSLMTDAANGGSGTKQYFEFIQNKQKKLAALVKNINQTGEKAWTEENYSGENIKRYAAYNGATCNIVSQDLDIQSKTELSQKVSLKDAKFDKCIYVTFDSGDGLTLIQQFAVLGIGSFVGPQLSNIILNTVSAVVRQMSIALTRTLASIEEAETGIEAVAETFEGTLEEVVAEGEILVEIELATFIGEGIIAVGAALMEFLLPIIATFLLIYLFEEYLLKRYVFYLDVINITEDNLVFNIPYLYNIDKSKAIIPSNMTLSKVRFGDSINLPGISNVTTNDILVSKATCLFVGDSKFFKGIGAIVAVNPNPNTGFKTVLGMVDIPRFINNSIDCWFNENAQNYESLFDDRSGAHKDYKHTSKYEHYKAIITMSELSGADNDTYYSTLFIVNDNTFKDYGKL
jgi:hypothetical protein